MDAARDCSSAKMSNAARLVFALSCLAGSGCAPVVYGRVVSDIRVANGFISVDRCLLKQSAYHRVGLSECETENYYIGKAVVPVQSTTTPWQKQ